MFPFSVKPSSGKRTKTASKAKTTNGHIVKSKILGEFVPKSKIAAVGAFSKQHEANGEIEDVGAKVSEMMTKAVKIN